MRLNKFVLTTDKHLFNLREEVKTDAKYLQDLEKLTKKKHCQLLLYIIQKRKTFVEGNIIVTTKICWKMLIIINIF